MKQNKRYIAVTGGIGSGKSVVLAAAEELGFAVFSADAIAKDIYADPVVFSEVRNAFPYCIRNGSIDRRLLAEEVFSSPEKLAVLNAVTHPAIMQRLFEQMQAAEGYAVFAEVPLLFEGGYADRFDAVIVVKRPREERIRSVIERDGLCREQVLARIKNQFDYEKNDLNGHTVIYNEGDLAAFKKLAKHIVRTLATQG